MLTTILLSALLMQGGAAVSDLQVYGKTIQSEKTLMSSDHDRLTVRRQPHVQTRREMVRSLDLTDFSVHMTPTKSKISLPTYFRLFPPTARPVYLHANMPMRFGRESEIEITDDKSPNSTPNMPQRFGRSWRQHKDVPGVPLPRKIGEQHLETKSARDPWAQA